MSTQPLASYVKSIYLIVKVVVGRLGRKIFAFIYLSVLPVFATARSNAVKYYKQVSKRFVTAEPVISNVVVPDNVLGTSKSFQLISKVMQALNKVGSWISSAFNDRKYLALKIPKKYLNGLPYAYGAVFVFTLVSCIVFVTAISQENHSARNAIAIQNSQTINSLVNSDKQELASLDHETCDDMTIPITNNSQQTTTKEEQPNQQIDPQDDLDVELKSLLSQIKNIVASDENALGQNDAKQAELLSRLEESPQLVTGLLSVYGDFPEDDEKLLLRTLLASTEDSAIEAYAMEQIEFGDQESSSDWIALLKQKGIHESTSRDTMVATLPQLNNPTDLSSAIRALSPDVVSLQERELVVEELANYANHSEERVRSAAIETYGKWGDPKNAHLIEEALFDASPSVRKAALFAAFSSTIRTDTIKSSLFQIMGDTDEDWSLRMDAYSALSSYTLDGSDYENFYRFDQMRKQQY